MHRLKDDLSSRGLSCSLRGSNPLTFVYLTKMRIRFFRGARSPGETDPTNTKLDFQNPVATHSKEILFSISIRLFVFSFHCCACRGRHTSTIFAKSIPLCSIGMTFDGRAAGDAMRTIVSGDKKSIRSLFLPERAQGERIRRAPRATNGILLSCWIPSSSSKLLLCNEKGTRRSSIAPSHVRPYSSPTPFLTCNRCLSFPL